VKYLAIGHAETAATATIARAADLNFVTRNIDVSATAVEDYNYSEK
jgi:hypothetical protein